LTTAPSRTPSPSLFPTKTLTQAPDPCDDIEIDPVFAPDDKYILKIRNNNPMKITIVNMSIHWPPEHVKLERVKLGSKTIWDDGDTDPPTDMPPWAGSAKDREIKQSDDKTLEFRFKEPAPGAAFNSYGLVITFEIEGSGTFCTLSP
jgi:hypothetical protein